MTACAERRPEGPDTPESMIHQNQLQMMGKEFCLVRMANQAKGHLAFVAGGKLLAALISTDQ